MVFYFKRALLGVIVFGSLWLVLLPEKPVCGTETMDWIGSCLGIGGLILFNFVWKYVCRFHPPSLK